MTGSGPDRSILPILLVRLRPRLPDGTVIGASRRVSHLVPLPQAGSVPAVLRTYCGQQIFPGTAELLDAIAGMPCEPCLARCPIPAFAMLRRAPGSTPPTIIASRHGEVAAQWDLGLPPQQRLTARFALLLLLQEPDRPYSTSEIAVLLEQDPHSIHVIMLLLAAVGWIHPQPDHSTTTWAERCHHLTERGRHLAPHLLGLVRPDTDTPPADRPTLDTTVASIVDTTGPGGCSAPTSAPTGHHPDLTDTTPNLEQQP